MNCSQTATLEAPHPAATLLTTEDALGMGQLARVLTIRWPLLEQNYGSTDDGEHYIAWSQDCGGKWGRLELFLSQVGSEWEVEFEGVKVVGGAPSAGAAAAYAASEFALEFLQDAA